MNTVERAKAIRKELKVSFPGVKFSVRSNKYSGGSSIHIRWTDFPTVAAVEEVTNKFASVRYCEVTGEILCGGNTFVYASNDFSDEMEASIKESIISNYGESFYNEQEKNYNLRRYQFEAFENLYLQSLSNAELDALEPISNNPIDESKVVLNDEKNGVEIYFNEVPSEDVRTALKENGFKWSRYNKCWYAKQSNETVSFANSILVDITEQDPEADTEYIKTIIQHAEEYANKVLKEEIKEIEDQDKYNVVETEYNIFLNDISISRKPSNINDVNQFTELENIVINKYLTLSNDMFNNLCNDFFMDFNPIAKQGGTRGFINNNEVDYDNYNYEDFFKDNSIKKYSDNILITNEDNTKFIVVNPEGHSYCRYVGKLTSNEGNNILNQLKGDTKINNLQVIESNIEHSEDLTNAQQCNNMYYEIEALENRLKLVTSAKLKYKIQQQINTKMQEIAKIIISDPILYAQFEKE